MRKSVWGIFFVLFGTLMFSSCSSDDESGSSAAELLKSANGIVPLKEHVGEWDAAYLTKLGYFCYSEDAIVKGKSLASKALYNSVTYMSPDGDDIVSLLSTKEDNIPTQMITDKGIVYFSYPNDSILELLYDDGKKVTMLDSIPYSKEQLPSVNMVNADAFKSTLANTAKFLKNNFSTRAMTTNSLSNAYGTIFEAVSNEPYVENPELVGQMTTNTSGIYTFVETIDNWYTAEVTEAVSYALNIWTGKATYKVGGSSCTLSGTIWCPSTIFNEYGTYGILCDEDKSKLTLGEAEYEGEGYQSDEDLSFSVDFRGFKPNTTYYYKAYYKFNTSDHGGITPKYGSATDQVIYDTTVKSFKTGDNKLTVDVVMCIDVTGSMSGIINTVKENAIGFYDSFNQCCAEEGIQLTSLNAQVIAYQDINCDGDRWLQVSETYSLPEQKEYFNDFVNALYADGGGDTPESGLEALDTAFSKKDWGVDDGYHRQVVILWTDAPYLVGEYYTQLTVEGLEAKWNAMPSGRRLILFAPYGAYDYNAGDWEAFDGWKNLIHESDLYNGFNNFEYILKSIIGELTSRATTRTTPKVITTKFRPNK